MTTDITAEFVSDFYGVKLTPHTAEGKELIKKLKGIYMKHIFIRPSEFDRIQSMMCLTFNTTKL